MSAVTTKKSSWYPTYHRRNKKRNDRYQNRTDLLKMERRREAGGGEFTVTMAVSAGK
jgi:hypothetical protein